MPYATELAMPSQINVEQDIEAKNAEVAWRNDEKTLGCVELEESWNASVTRNIVYEPTRATPHPSIA